MKIVLLGSGPDRIGKAGELDRFAVQALRYLKESGHQPIWVDENPSTFAGSRSLGCRVYLEPLNINVLEKILERERPDALMHAFGGCLGQHLVIFLEREGVLDRLGIQILGAQVADLKRILDPEILHKILADMGIPSVESAVAHTPEECLFLAKSLGFPLLIRPNLALEGMGGYLLFNLEEVSQMAGMVLSASPVREALLEEPPLGWRLLGLECFCDHAGSGEILWHCTWESLEGGVGVHMGNSQLVSPAPNLTGKFRAQALEWAGRLAGQLKVSGNLQLRLALSPEEGKMLLLGLSQGLNRFSSFLSLPRALALGRLTAAAALGNLQPQMPDLPALQTADQDAPAPTLLRTPHFSDPCQGNDSMKPTLWAVGASITVGGDAKQCREKLEGRGKKPVKGEAPGMVCAAGEKLCFLGRASKVGDGTATRPASGLEAGAVLILGPGPYRIGWAGEVDYALIQTIHALKERGKRVILINDNPDAVSLDSDLVDMICLEPATLPVIQAVLARWPVEGLIHHFCPSLPAGLEPLLVRKKVKILGTPLASLERINHLPTLWPILQEMGVPLLSHAWAADARAAREQAEKLTYPVLVRLSDERINPPSDIFYGPDELGAFLGQCQDRLSALHPLFIEKFTDGMVGAQLLAVSDARDCLCLNLLENIEEYGIHSGDCAAINVALSVGEMPRAIAESALKVIARHFGLKGHVKLDLAVSGRQCFVTGVQPYPSPALALADKADSQNFHELAARVLLGEKIDRSQRKEDTRFTDYMVKESVFSFFRFPGLDPMLTSRMRSTGQVLGRDNSIGKAYYKSQLSVNPELPSAGNVFLSARDNEKDSIFQIALKLRDMGFNLVSTQGTAHFLAQRGLKVTQVHKVSEQRPNIFDLIKNGEINLVINIPAGRQPKLDDQKIRRAAIEQNILLITTLSGAFLMVSGLVETAKSPLNFSPLAQGEDCLGS